MASRSQTWSIDILIALSIFIIGIIVFFFVATYSGGKTKVDRIGIDSAQIPGMLITTGDSAPSNTSIVVGNKVDSARLANMMDMSYEQVKRELGIQSDFCIHFEDPNTGDLVDIDPDPARTRYSIGSPNINISVINETGGVQVLPCGT